MAPVAADAVPEPYHGLLVGDHDMTPVLAAFHRQPIHLRVIERETEGNAYTRLVVLTAGKDARPVEFGAIVIDLTPFPADARTAVLDGVEPLGTILATYKIDHLSRPRAFIRVTSNPFINEHLGLTGDHELYGRRNVLTTLDHQVFADIVEILPVLTSS